MRYEVVTMMTTVFQMAPAPAKALWYVPTTDGYSRLLRLEAPDAFWRALDEIKPK